MGTYVGGKIGVQSVRTGSYERISEMRGGDFVAVVSVVVVVVVVVVLF